MKTIEFFRLFLWAHALRKKEAKKEMKEIPSYRERWTLFNLSRDQGPVCM